MRCIEILFPPASSYIVFAININMRCIEISNCHTKSVMYDGLTLTWDVLKYMDI